MKARALAFVILAACGGPAKPAAPPPEPEPAAEAAAASCADAAAHLGAIATQAGVNTAEQEPTIVRILGERCEADAWPEAARACFATATGETIESCANDHLTQAQMDA